LFRKLNNCFHIHIFDLSGSFQFFDIESYRAMCVAIIVPRELYRFILMKSWPFKGGAMYFFAVETKEVFMPYR